MLKRNLALVTLLVLTLSLAACSTASPTSTTTETDASSTSADGTTLMRGELSTVARDILGIFKLEGTELAVDSVQAAALLPLWQAYRSLLNSDTTASAELEALQTQIDEALTAEQRDAIAAMNLTPQDMFAMAQELGVTQPPTSAEGTDNGSNGPIFTFGDGGPGGAEGPRLDSGGGMPVPEAGGGFVIQGEGNMPAGGAGGFDPSLMMGGTPQPGQAARSGQGDRMSMMLLDPLIKLLKERAGS